ncbi:alpha-galactosidase [Modestobacter sp. I12A-02628]|uniref:Alpha-galactosidase n=1 Tax=Goekera deserti TaxID=2497753 RepID=A0A7K3WB42_9ACTN|nr:glycoside hydrolase family 36 protein [Goekera deserti]MPQ97466.1 alpha-galactosidase [Goekera deserti]NDI47933.1 alpha-galactosidase [Goekera deserti]NEL53681.1 alpha-galactosidase [Goekera deserti]
MTSGQGPGGAAATTVQVEVDPDAALVYEHGWQSWSPTAAYRLDEDPFRPVSDFRRVGNYHPDRAAPQGAFCGEGLLAVDPGTGEGVHVFGAVDPAGPVPQVTATVQDGHVVVRSTGECAHQVVDPGPVGATAPAGATRLDVALARWADGVARTAGVPPLRAAPTVWCSWYHYYTRVTQDDVEENLQAIEDLALPVDVVQIDDGYQAEIGDWLTLSDRFSSLADVVDRIRARGRRAGIWVAPFLVGARSATAREHPGWLVGGAEPAEGWDQALAALDVTSPGVEDHLREVFGTLRSLGIDYFKIDFLYAGAMEGQRADPAVTGVPAYRRGLEVIREAIGPESYLLGCGAPVLPSVGLVDAMRIGPDIDARYEPSDGDLSQPSQRAAAQNSRWRAWQQGRFWVNDADCLVAGPHVERREDWADVVERFSGLRASSDRLVDLDEWGLQTTRRLLADSPVDPFVP